MSERDALYTLRGTVQVDKAYLGNRPTRYSTWPVLA